MTTHIPIVGGPSREDLFDNIRLASGSCLLPLFFKVNNSQYSLTLAQVHNVERVDKDPRTREHFDWIVKAECEMHPDYKEPDTEMFQQYALELRYNTKTRQGSAVLNRIEGKTSKFWLTLVSEAFALGLSSKGVFFYTKFI